VRNVCAEVTAWRSERAKSAPAGEKALKEEFGGDVEAAAEAFDVVLVEFSLAV